MSRRNTVLYKDGPVEVKFPEIDEEANVSFSLKVLDAENVLLDDFGEGIPSMKVRINDTVISPVGRLIVNPTWRYADFTGQEIMVVHAPLSKVASYYRSRIVVERDNDKNAILRLSVRDASPVRAAEVLNALMDTYNEESIADQQRVLDYTEKFINDRIEYLMNDIDEYEQASVSFKRSHNIIDTKSFGEAYVAASAARTEEAKQLDVQADMVRYLLGFVKSNEDQMIPVGVVPVSAEAASVISKYNDNLVKIEKYKNDGTLNNPVAQALLNEQVSLRLSIITLLETNLAGLEDRIAAANRERSIANSQIQSVPVAQLQLNSVERMQGIKEKLYLQLLTKREELLMTSPQLEATGKVLDYAQSNPNPIAPDETRVVLIGVLIGLAIPILILVLSKMLDTTIHDRIDVQKSSNVPFLGDIPFQKNTPDHAIVVKENGRDSLSESFRLIRSTLEYMKDRKEGAHVVMFTSFMVSSGKTFVSTNLATSFALASRKTVIVDLDIRKGTLFKVFGVNTRAGVSNYLSGKTDSVDDIIHSDTNTPNLDIIFSGPVPPNPAELLMSTRLDDLIAELRKRYEYIFLDNVPVGMVADSDIVKRVADTTIMVLRAGKTDKRLLFDVDKFYKDGKFPNLCVVLISVNKK
ncbi:MAG: polysaccharide biosynthesis tyrosine autokinase [Prevotella sp.]|nr:polysaccharide biosynthesis tyrosine autokinase [Prevotella sp.]